MTRFYIRRVGVLSLAILVAATGCVAPHRYNAKEAFLAKRPEERVKYVRLGECSPEMYEYFIQRQMGVTMGLLNAFEKLTLDGPSPRARDYVTKTRKLLRDSNKDERKFIAEISASFDPKTDHLFYYSYDHGRKLEQGWMIVAGGEIKKKFGVMEMELGSDLIEGR